MALYYASINSGSNGNCYYLGNDQEAVLIDAGIHCSEIENRITRLGIDIKKIKALFITHEHTDHIKGAYKLSKKYNLPVYLSPGTLSRSFFDLKKASTYPLQHEQEIMVGQLSVKAFTKEHDAADPLSFIIENQGVRVGVMTDIGTTCNQVKKYFALCHAAILESNYDEELLLKGAYPYYLKQRIRSGKGHISNHQAYTLFREYKSPQLQHLILAHLSKENNREEIVEQLFRNAEHNVRIDIASRYTESELFYISHHTLTTIAPRTEQLQLSL